MNYTTWIQGSSVGKEVVILPRDGMVRVVYTEWSNVYDSRGCLQLTKFAFDLMGNR